VIICQHRAAASGNHRLQPVVAGNIFGSVISDDSNFPSSASCRDLQASSLRSPESFPRLCPNDCFPLQGLGRGAGVGRDLGVTLGLAVGVGLAVAVGVVVGVAVVVAVGEGVALGEGVGLPEDSI
jgi:hypothetical protein